MQKHKDTLIFAMMTDVLSCSIPPLIVIYQMPLAFQGDWYGNHYCRFRCFLFYFFWPLFWPPLVIPDCKRVDHYCPHCETRVERNQVRAVANGVVKPQQHPSAVFRDTLELGNSAAMTKQGECRTKGNMNVMLSRSVYVSLTK
mmetsp:Transcript_41769/g.100585  ORF Transcript_41769/g.100585 Transcript_41769/m.100585 type:complete len:143 (-) Transcript_41769:1572-2000(-)